MTDKTQRSGFVLICGVPNAGKSTFLNSIVQEKISAVTDKPQTTRKRITGIYTDLNKNIQIVFIDTPGFHTSNNLINKLFNEAIFESIKEIDLIFYITDISVDLNEDEINLLNKVEDLFKNHKKTVICLFNKIDKGINKKKHEVLHQKNFISKYLNISAINLDINQIIETIYNLIPENPFYYPEDMISTMYEKDQVVEIIQEKIFLTLYEEVPYSTYVEVLQFKEDESQIEIDANICCEKESQKPIIIGKNAEVIKKIRKLSEKDLKFIFDKKVRLNLFVKVVKNWTKKEYVLKELGLNISKLRR